MTTLEAIRIALLSLWANKLRSALTLLGVVIGVAAVIAVVTFVNGINGYVAEKIFNLGADVFIISKVTPSGAVSTFVDNTHGLSSPSALAFDSSGNLFVANSTNNTIDKVTPPLRRRSKPSTKPTKHMVTTQIHS